VVLVPLAALVFKASSLSWQDLVTVLLDEAGRRLLPLSSARRS